MHKVLEYVVKELVDNPAQCVVEIVTTESGVKYVISVASADRGKVIGRQGNTIKALRMLMHALSKNGNVPAVDIAAD
jgi:uncharacterized protein